MTKERIVIDDEKECFFISVDKNVLLKLFECQFEAENKTIFLSISVNMRHFGGFKCAHSFIFYLIYLLVNTAFMSELKRMHKEIYECGGASGSITV